jgi:hypothetical protein
MANFPNQDFQDSQNIFQVSLDEDPMNTQFQYVVHNPILYNGPSCTGRFSIFAAILLILFFLLTKNNKKFK